MSLDHIFSLAASGMNAQSVRMNTVASNLSNADTVAKTPEEAYHALEPIFTSESVDFSDAWNSVNGSMGVHVSQIAKHNRPNPMEYAPDHPLANEKGYIYRSNVNLVEEMTNMISASRAYQSNVDVFSAAKDLLLQTLKLGQ